MNEKINAIATPQVDQLVGVQEEIPEFLKREKVKTDQDGVVREGSPAQENQGQTKAL
jgi:hypothetical protein